MVSSARILLTTSRNPTPKIRTFCNDLVRVIPGAVRVNGGKMSADEVAERALEHNSNRVVIVDRWQGEAAEIKFFEVGVGGLVLVPPVIQVSSIVLMRKFGFVSKVRPAVSLVLLTSNVSEGVLSLAEMLSKFLGVSVASAGEAVKTGTTSLVISHEKSSRIVLTFMVEPNHVEVGPRIVVSGVQW